MPSVQDLLARNADYQCNHTLISTFREWFAAGKTPPAVAIVTCADPRCIPEEFLKLKTWDAVVIRNAGSNVKAALPSLIAIDNLVGLQEIMVINHTDCGALMFRDETIKQALKKRAPDMRQEIDIISFGEITSNLEDRVREHVAIAKGSPLLREELRARVTGYVYDLERGFLKGIE